MIKEWNYYLPMVPVILLFILMLYTFLTEMYYTKWVMLKGVADTLLLVLLILLVICSAVNLSLGENMKYLYCLEMMPLILVFIYLIYLSFKISYDVTGNLSMAIFTAIGYAFSTATCVFLFMSGLNNLL